MAMSSISASPLVAPPSLSTPQQPSCVLLAHSSSLQLPPQFRRRGFVAQISPSSLKSRALTVVAAKKQTFSSFDDLLAKCDKPVVVDFYATWCGPCQLMARTLDEVSNILKDKVQVVKIDTEKYPSIADKYRIEALPTFIIFKDGEPFDRFEGAYTTDQFILRIENSLNVKK